MKQIKCYSLAFLILANIFYANSQSWWKVGSGLSGYDPWVNSLLAYDSVLYVGGTFDSVGGLKTQSIAQWDGSNWSTLGSGANGQIYAMAIYHGKLYVAGLYFDSAGGVQVSGIAAWDGIKWTNPGGGLRPQNFSEPNAMAVYKNELYVCGVFDSAGGKLTPAVAKWNDTDWSTVGSDTSFKWRSTAPLAMAVYRNKLYVSGEIDSVDGMRVGGIVNWDGTKWDSVGSYKFDEIGGGGTSLLAYDSLLFMGGGFGDLQSSNAKLISHVAQWNDTIWDSLGIAWDCPGSQGYGAFIYALANSNGLLYAGGTFDSAGGKIENNIASWDGATWSNLGAGLSGPNWWSCEVKALAIFKGDLYAGGTFDSAGGQPCLGLARWGGVLAGGVEQNAKDEGVKVYPNPTTGIAEIVVSGQWSMVSEMQVEVFNVFGQKVYSAPFQLPPASSTCQINLSSQPEGVYFYRVLKEEIASPSLAMTVVGQGKLIIEK